jgi:LuxR family maltose regulon positive regulatory protein
MCAALCDAVRFGSAESQSRSEGTAVRSGAAESPTAAEDSQAILEAIESANLCIEPLDDQRGWYRYHRLLADLLRLRLHRDGRFAKRELHRRASRWCEENELYAEAVNHALEWGELQRAVDLIEWIAWRVLERGEMVARLGWIDSLPEHLVCSSPQLGILQAWALAFTGQLDAVEPLLQEVGVQQVPGDAAAVSAYVAASQGDVSKTKALASQALAQLPERKWFSRWVVAESGDCLLGQR